MADFNDFLRDLEQFGDNINNLDNTLLAISGKLVEGLKATAPVDTGNLRNSIRGIVEDNTIKIAMAAYGSFQNYGVAGTEGDSRFGIVEEVPAGVLPVPFMGSKYQYKERSYGIPAQNWYDLDSIKDAFYNEITNTILF